MPPLAVLRLTFSFISLLAPHGPQMMGVADHYSLWLSDTSLGVQPNGGGMVRMDFPAAPRAISSDGRRVEYVNVFPDIDLVIYRNGHGFEYNWEVPAAVDPSSPCSARCCSITPSAPLRRPPSRHT